MLIKKSQRVKHTNSPKCVAYEYPTGDKDIDIAFIEIGGRYPSKGRAVNKFKEIIFVSKGKGKVVMEGRQHNLEEGDVVLISPDKKYFFHEKLKLVVSCSPAFDPEKHKLVED